MGWTVIPYSQVMESEGERLKPFRRVLSNEDQRAFDRLFDRAKMHTSAGVYMANPWPMETIPLSIVLEQGKVIEGIPEEENIEEVVQDCMVTQKAGSHDSAFSFACLQPLLLQMLHKAINVDAL